MATQIKTCYVSLPNPSAIWMWHLLPSKKVGISGDWVVWQSIWCALDLWVWPATFRHFSSRTTRITLYKVIIASFAWENVIRWNLVPDSASTTDDTNSWLPWNGNATALDESHKIIRGACSDTSRSILYIRSGLFVKLFYLNRIDNSLMYASNTSLEASFDSSIDIFWCFATFRVPRCFIKP